MQEEQAGAEPTESPDPSHDLDLVTAFVSDAHNAELLALGVQSLLEAQDIPTVLVSGSQLPSLPFEVRVPRERLEEALAVLAAVEQSGPEAAEAAEREFEAAGGSEGVEQP
jgi:hypothetical protein